MITEKGLNMDFMFRNSKYIVTVINVKSDPVPGNGSQFIEKIINIYKIGGSVTTEVGIMLFFPWLKVSGNKKTLKVGGNEYILLGKDRDMTITHSKTFHEDGATPRRNIITTYMQCGTVYFLDLNDNLNKHLKKLGVEMEWEEIQKTMVINKIAEGTG